jgi:hypothetical protein
VSHCRQQTFITAPPQIVWNLLANISIRCLDTGTFVPFVLTEAQGGTFVDGEAGMEPSRKGRASAGPGQAG